MKKPFIPFLLIFIFNDSLAQQQFQLAPPLFKYHSVFFKYWVPASLNFRQDGTQIVYTLNNKEPGVNSAVYQKPVIIKKSFTTLKAKVIGKNFLSSETVQATFIKDGLKIKATEQPKANERFLDNGSKTLFDNDGGIGNLHNKNYLGYQLPEVVIKVTLEKKAKIKSVLINFLQDHDSWIFLPQHILLLYLNKKTNVYEMLAQKEISPGRLIKGSSSVFEILKSTKKIKTSELKIILQSVNAMPDGHPGVGKQSWLFIDEIKIY